VQRTMSTDCGVVRAAPTLQMAAETLGVPYETVTVSNGDTDVDAGPIIAQRRVSVRPDETVESLRARIQEEEHTLLPVVVRRLAGQVLPLPV